MKEKELNMCGRFIQISNPERIKVKIPELEISDEVNTGFTPRYNISPTQNIQVLIFV